MPIKRPRFSGRKKLRISMRLILKKDDKVVLTTNCQRKAMITSTITRVPHDKGYIKVHYGRGLWNDGWYDTDAKLLGALDAFTERELLKIV